MENRGIRFYSRCAIALIFLFIFKVGNAQEIYKYQAHTKSISAIAFSHGGDTIISYGNDKLLVVHNIQDRSLTTLTGVADGRIITRILTSPIDDYVAFQTWGDKIFVTRGGRTIIDVIESRSEVKSFEFSIFERNTLYFLDNNKLMKWSWPSKEVVSSGADPVTGNVKMFALCNKSDRIITVLDDNSVSCVNKAKSSDSYLVFNEQKNEVAAVAVSPDDAYLAIGFKSGTIEIFDLETGKFVKGIHDITTTISCLVFAPQGPYLVSRSMDMAVRIWYVPEGQLIFSSEGGPTGPNLPRAIISSNGKYLAINKDYITVQYFDLRRILSQWLSNQGELASNNFNLGKAEEYCSHSIEIFPGYDYYYKRGMIRLKLRKQADAFADFTDALKYRPLGKEALLERCKINYEKNNNEDALADCNTIGRLYIQDSLCWGLKGMILFNLGRYSECRKAIDSAMAYSRNPDNYRLLRALAMKKAGLYQEAIEDLTLLISKQRKPEFLMNRSLCYYSIKNYFKSYADLKLLGEQNKNYPGQKKYIAFTALLTANYAEAQEYFTELQTNDQTERDVMLGSAFAYLLSQKSNEEAQLAIGRLLRIQPKNYDLHFLRGIAFIFLDDLPSAYEIISKVYKPNPEYEFKLKDTLQLNANDAIQNDFHDLLNCLSINISKIKLDYSEQTYAERLEDYKLRVEDNQQKLKTVIDNCSKSISDEFRQAFFNSKTLVEVKIDSIKCFDQIKKKYWVFVKGKKYIPKGNPAFESLLKDNWRTVIVKAEQRYSGSLKQFEYLNLVAGMPNYSIECSLVLESQAKAAETEALAQQEKQKQAEAWQRGVKEISVNKPIEHKITGESYLLMIGVNNYTNWPKLKTPVSDVRDLENLLWEKYQFTKEHTFELLNEDFTKESLDSKFERLIDTLNENDKLLVYYAGHGFKDKKVNEGYWIPYNARIGMRTDYIQNSQIVTYIKAIKAKHILLIMDACYSGTLVLSERGAPTTSLDKLEESRSRYALASGREENVDDEINGSGHSPFAWSLISFLKDAREDLSIGDLSARVISAVGNNANQLPVWGPIQNVGHMYGQFVFHLKK